MGVPWLAQVRFLHLAILGLATATCILYVAYMTAPQLTTTASPLRTLVSSEVRAVQGNISQAAEVPKNVTAAPSNSASSEAPPVPPPPPAPAPEKTQEPKSPVNLQPPAVPVSARSSINTTNNTQPDLTRGIPAQTIYEAGHVDISSKVCPELGKNVRLLIAITSAPSHESARMAIRETWGHFASRKDVAIAFMLGSNSNQTINANIEKEQYLYGDIIRGKFIDTYDNLTLKTISMLEWVDNYCPKAAFVLKTDDDMFINVSRLLAFIAKHKPEQRAIYGRLAKKWKPIRNKKSKYYISPQQYKPPLFPDFTTGPAYLFPARISKELYIAALNHTYFKLEDVFVTGIVANDLKIKRIHASEFLNKRVSHTACNVQKGISIHMVKGVEQYDLWKKLHDVAAKCKKKKK